MGRGVLVVDVVAVHGHAVAGLPLAHSRAHAQHHARGVGADDVLVDVVAGPPHRLAPEAFEEQERRQRLKDRRPHRVEVDGAGHDRDHGLVGGQLGQGDLVDVERLPGVFLAGVKALEHLRLVLADEGGAVRLGQRQAGELLAGRPRLDGIEDLLHPAKVVVGRWRPPPDPPWPTTVSATAARLSRPGAGQGLR
jgi:hypothetical protein